VLAVRAVLGEEHVAPRAVLTGTIELHANLAESPLARIDLTAQHFQTFLKLAPQAPERGEVRAIMKTLNR